MTQIVSRGAVMIDVEACKGCELCIAVCPPNVLFMSEGVNQAGYRYPVLVEGCTGCSACKEVCPDYVFDVFRFSRPAAAANSGVPA
ncbi:MAG TPA: 4Fe-4S dicluster domain-containing protein [Paracoccus sp.]|nr:4Fe-4S dicluster domain-containing protein [Paracoccus sp. (in: a-proteobacteria)]